MTLIKKLEVSSLVVMALACASLEIAENIVTLRFLKKRDEKPRRKLHELKGGRLSPKEIS